MKKIIFSLLVLFLPFISFSQSKKIDSLLAILKKEKEDTNKVKTLNILSRNYIQISNYDSAIICAEEARKVSKLFNYKKGISTSYNNLGISHMFLGNYPKALEYYMNRLKISEEINEKKDMAGTLHNIGLIYNDQQDNVRALEYFSKALKINQEMGNKLFIGNNLNGIGNCYKNLGKKTEALEYYTKALDVYRATGSKGGMANIFASMAEINEKEGDFLNAERKYKEALSIFQEMSNKSSIAQVYRSLGDINIKLGKLEQAQKYLSASLLLSKETGEKIQIQHSYSSISKLDSTFRNWRNAYENKKMELVYRDSVLNEETNKKLLRSQMQYEFDKKETELKSEQDKKDVIIEEEKQRQKIVIYSVSIGLFLVLLLALFIFRGYRQKQKANVIITQQKGIVEEKNKLVEEKQKEILDSIRYAKRIQRALLASDSYLNKNLPEHFILYKPKDIVSGDFYWALQANGSFLVLIGDCTGHGVPGAFMSLLNISFLNEVALERKTIRPDLILNDVREQIIKTLNPEGTETEGKDGMDCILCSFNFNKNTLEIACANNPLWIVRNKEVIEFKPDKMPVGKHSGEAKNFTLQKTELQKGDTIYTFTDGYADQFGGPKGKKFKYKQLEEKLLAISDKPMAEQKNILEKTFEDWKGNLEQVDDVLVIGIRV